MSELYCPRCGISQFVDGEDLPSTSCGETDYECSECGHVFMIGWIAEVEIRDSCLKILDAKEQER